MYGRFVQFVIPRIGQALVALLLWLHFLPLPAALFPAASLPVPGWVLPAVLTAGVLWAARNPLGPGMVFAGLLTAVYLACDLAGLFCRLAGGGIWQLWQGVYRGGLLAWAVTAAWMLYGWRRARRLHTTRYRLTTPKPLPGGRLRVVQISDLHAGSTMHAGRAEELVRKVNALQPDLLVLTGDIFDEATPRRDFTVYCDALARMQARWGKFFIYGNHDLGQFFRRSSFTGQELAAALRRADIQILADRAVTLTAQSVPLRLVGRRDWLFCRRHRLDPRRLMPAGPDGIFTLWLDHEPRELGQAAAAGADLILCGHTHAGQLWPVGLVARLFGFNELNYGKKQVAGALAIVSGGTGTWGYPLRTEGRTELVCVEVLTLPAPPGR